jgi:hypothetical protein
MHWYHYDKNTAYLKKIHDLSLETFVLRVELQQLINLNKLLTIQL